MSSGSPGNTRAKRGKQRKVVPRKRTQLRREPFECGRCSAPVSAARRRATIAGVRVCWRCAGTLVSI